MENKSLVPLDKKQIIVRGGVVISSLVVLSLCATLLWQAVLAGVSILILLGIFGVCATILYALPLLGQKLENRILKFRKNEARENPIEQMQNRLIQKDKSISEAGQALGIISGHIEKMKRMIQERQASDPNHNLSSIKKSLETIEKFLTTQIGNLKKAKEAREEFKRAIERRKFELEFAELGQSAMKGLKGAEGDVVQDILTDEAMDEIENKFNSVFGMLEVETILNQADQIKTNDPIFGEGSS